MDWELHLDVARGPQINQGTNSSNVQVTNTHVVIKFFFIFTNGCTIYRSADKSLARPGRKQATATEDFEIHIPYL